LFEALASALSDEAKESVFFLWYEVYGNPKGVPAVHVHGGPGYHSDYDDRCFFNPSLFKVILFDQRGCGHSVPRLSKRSDFGLFESTTLNGAIQDMEEVRRQLLGKESWVVLGVSWGSALSLMYAEHFPNRVSSLILQGVYTGHISEHRPLVDGARLNLEHREAWNCLRDALLPPALQEIVNLRKTTGTDHHDAKVSTDEKSSPIDQVVELPTEEALWRDPIKLHDHARWLIQSPLVPDDVANCVLGVWEMFENYMTYPEDRAHYLKEMINALKLSGIRSETSIEGTSNSTSTPASRAWTPSPTDVSQTAFQVILFPQMMKLDPPIASEALVKKIGLQTPVTIVHGTGDDVCPVAAADTLYRSLLAARTSSNSGTGNGKKGGTNSGDSTSTKGKKGVQYMRITGAAHSSSSLQTNHWLVEATNAAWEHAFGDDDS
jgi:pimeloyl-ACP methyl ester carboxylesterase